MSVIQVIRGDDTVRTITVTQDGAPVDLTTALAIRFTAKRQATDHQDDAVLAYELAAGIEVAANVATISFDAADTEGEPAPAVWYADLEVTDAAGEKATVWIGYVELLADVTTAASGS